MGAKKLLATLAQPSLFASCPLPLHRSGRTYLWSALEESRFRSEGIVPVEVVQRARKSTGIVVRLGPEGHAPGILRSPCTTVEIQSFEESGYPLLSLTIAFGRREGEVDHSLGLLLDYGDERDRRHFEGLARQDRLALFCQDAAGGWVGCREVGLSLWNRVQVYQALEAGERIWRRPHASRPTFLVAQAQWTRRQEAALGLSTPADGLDASHAPTA